MKLIFWSNLPQKFFDLVKSSIFCARRNRVVNGSRPRMGNLGRVKLWRQIENERFSYVGQVL